MREYLKVSDEVADTIRAGGAVVALESTIITHGMPYPENLETAKAVEQVVRENGAVPATIAIMDGYMMAGLTDDALEKLAEGGLDAVKASRRDVAALLAKGRSAGTTVATTMQIAALAGIKIFATGGIGGVHRGAEHSFDISADLKELSQTQVAVICAGAKSILDIPKTLEVLESNGVPVLGYGTDEFPAFYLRSSGQPVDHRMDSPREVARMLKLQFGLEMGGVLIGNPIPEADELDIPHLEKRIQQALHRAEEEHISRKDVTPFLLEAMYDLTEGKSLVANIALVKNNARVASQIAVALAAEIVP